MAEKISEGQLMVKGIAIGIAIGAALGTIWENKARSEGKLRSLNKEEQKKRKL